MAVHASPGVAIRRSGVEASAPRDRRGAEVAICVALAGGIAFQVFQRMVNNGYELSPYGRSLWYVSYEFGFVRRGLAGELLRRLLGRTPTVPEVALVQNAIAVLTLAVAVLVVVVLCRQRTVIGYSLAALLVVSPFAFDFVGGSRRPDLVAFLLLAAVVVWVGTRATEPVLVGLTAGGLLAASAFFSEAGPLVVGPWLVLVVAALARSRARSRWESGTAMLAAAVPSMVTLAALSFTGRADRDMTASLEQVAPLDVGGIGTVFPYLDDTLGVSVAKVLDRRPVLSLVVGALLLAMMWFLARRFEPGARALVRWVLPGRGARLLWCAGLAGTTLLLFALGFDWMRWVTSIALSAMLAAAAVVVLARDPATRPDGLDDWFAPVPTRAFLSARSIVVLGVGTYLLVLPPLPTAVRGIGQTARLLVNAPG
jgi:hypothetical protein